LIFSAAKGKQREILGLDYEKTRNWAAVQGKFAGDWAQAMWTKKDFEMSKSSGKMAPKTPPDSAKSSISS
jgi:hypothetical protein